MADPRPVGFRAPAQRPSEATTSLVQHTEPTKPEPITISFEEEGAQIAFFDGHSAAFNLTSVNLALGRVPARDRAVARGLLLYALDRLDKEDARG